MGYARHKDNLIRVFHDSAVEFRPFFTLALECLAGSHQKSKFLGGGLRVLLKGWFACLRYVLINILQVLSRGNEQGNEECVASSKDGILSSFIYGEEGPNFYIGRWEAWIIH